MHFLSFSQCRASQHLDLLPAKELPVCEKSVFQSRNALCLAVREWHLCLSLWDSKIAKSLSNNPMKNPSAPDNPRLSRHQRNSPDSSSNNRPPSYMPFGPDIEKSVRTQAKQSLPCDCRAWLYEDISQPFTQCPWLVRIHQLNMLNCKTAWARKVWIKRRLQRECRSLKPNLGNYQWQAASIDWLSPVGKWWGFGQIHRNAVGICIYVMINYVLTGLTYNSIESSLDMACW